MAKRLCNKCDKNLVLKRITLGSRGFPILLWFSKGSSGCFKVQDRSEPNRVPVAWRQGGMDFCLSRVTHGWESRKRPDPGTGKGSQVREEDVGNGFVGNVPERQTRGVQTNRRCRQYSWRPGVTKTDDKQRRYSHRWGLADSLASRFGSRSSNSR